MAELQYDMYTTLATLYDTQDLNMPTSKAQRIGTIAETVFIKECLERDFEPHPTTTPMPWDFIVSCPAGDLKVQVKSTSCNKDNAYVVNTGCGRIGKEHIPDIVDVVAVYLAPINEWWMIPQSVITSLTIKLYTENISKSKYKKYQNNWSVYYE